MRSEGIVLKGIAMEKRQCEICERMLPVFNPLIMEAPVLSYAPNDVPEDRLYAFLVSDPYAEELWGDTSLRWLCQNCEETLRMEI